uniref:Uncharacterized protein n=1 Tax=Arundo donax TaxID=35708 RepID=A0A0A9ERA0_ARUDO
MRPPSFPSAASTLSDRAHKSCGQESFRVACLVHRWM